MELSSASTPPNFSYSLLCVAVGCLMQERLVVLTEAKGQLRVRAAQR